MKRFLRASLLPHLIGLSALALPAWAGENVILANGFRLHADRHEVDGGVVRIYSGGGAMEMPAASVAGYEQEEVLAAPAVTAPAAAPLPAPAIPIPKLSTAASTPFNTTPADLANAAAKKYNLPNSFVRSVMKAESGFQPNALSPKGAIGLMQLMPDTARTLGADPHDPVQNADAGARYLRDLLSKYENDPNQVLLALAAYNAGPGAVEKYHGVPPYRETREYILRVLKSWDQQRNK